METDSEPATSQPFTSRNQTAKKENPPKKQKQTVESVSDDVSLDSNTKKKDKPAVTKKKKKTKKPKIASVVLTQPTGGALEDVSAEETARSPDGRKHSS